MKEEIELALRWFKAKNIPITVDDGSLYVEFRDELIQISEAETLYRADLQKGIEDEKVSSNL